MCFFSIEFNLLLICPIICKRVLACFEGEGILLKALRKRVYRILREYKLHKLRLMILARLLYGKKIELVIDGAIVDIANVN